MAITEIKRYGVCTVIVGLYPSDAATALLSTNCCISCYGTQCSGVERAKNLCLLFSPDGIIRTLY